MKRLEGIHFYINVSNLLNIIEEEEKQTKKINHALHAIDTYFTAIEHYAKSKYSETLSIEKITGSRLHMYVVDEENEAFDVVKDISTFALELSHYIHTEIGKYKTIQEFHIQVGACYGRFYDFCFVKGDVEENTTIGFAANYAAKLQNLTKLSYISISSNLFEKLEDDEKISFEKIKDVSIRKYEQTQYYTSQISKLKCSSDFKDGLIWAFNYANNLNLSDIKYSDANVNIDFSSIGRTDCKKIRGVPFFADIRGFTKQFDKDDSNLEEMASKTQRALELMYTTIISYHGDHIQFQGDREVALFHRNQNSEDFIIDAITSALKIIDGIKGISLYVGVGQSIGDLFVSRIGTRGEKDNIIIGKTVNNADRYEDNYAQENQLVVSKEIYDYLYVNNRKWALQFKPVNKECYCITIGYKQLLTMVQEKMQSNNTRQNKYNGAWCE